MYNWDTNYLGHSAAEEITMTNSISNYNNGWTIWSGETTQGYNIVTFPSPLFYNKGTLLDIYSPSDARVAINTASTAYYRDYFLSGGYMISANENVFANVITQSTSGVGTRINSFSHYYSNPGSYAFYTHFYCNDLLYDKLINVVGKLTVYLMLLCLFHFMYFFIFVNQF